MTGMNDVSRGWTDVAQGIASTGDDATDFGYAQNRPAGFSCDPAGGDFLIGGVVRKHVEIMEKVEAAEILEADVVGVSDGSDGDVASDQHCAGAPSVERAARLEVLTQ